MQHNWRLMSRSTSRHWSSVLLPTASSRMPRANTTATGTLRTTSCIRDPLFFAKQRWFNTTHGADQPSPSTEPIRGERWPQGLSRRSTATRRRRHRPRGNRPDLMRLEADWYGLDMVFERPSNPHSGCFFVDQEQMGRLAAHPLFGVPRCRRSYELLRRRHRGPWLKPSASYEPATADGRLSRSRAPRLTLPRALGRSRGRHRRGSDSPGCECPEPTWPPPIWPLCRDRSRGALPLRCASGSARWLDAGDSAPATDQSRPPRTSARRLLNGTSTSSLYPVAAW